MFQTECLAEDVGREWSVSPLQQKEGTNEVGTTLPPVGKNQNCQLHKWRNKRSKQCPRGCAYSCLALCRPMLVVGMSDFFCRTQGSRRRNVQPFFVFVGQSQDPGSLETQCSWFGNKLLRSRPTRFRTKHGVCTVLPRPRHIRMQMREIIRDGILFQVKTLPGAES